jgi:hypothetical protein
MSLPDTISPLKPRDLALACRGGRPRPSVIHTPVHLSQAGNTMAPSSSQKVHQEDTPGSHSLALEGVQGWRHRLVMP